MAAKGILMTQSISDRALEYVRNHPGAQAADIAAAIGTTRTSASNMMIGLERRGLVTSKRVDESNARDRRRAYYPAHQPRDTSEIVSRARQIGGPFGLLVAQLTR